MRPIRILIIDDEQDDTALAAKILSSDVAGSEVRVVASAVQFAESLAAASFDVAIIETRVSWAGGLELIDTLKRAASPRPVVLFSAHSDNTFLSAALTRGLDGFVVKSSAGFFALPETVRSALSRRPAQQGLGDGALRQLFERSQVALFQCTPAGRLIDANGPFATLLGFTLDAADGVDVLERMLTAERRYELLGRLQLDRFTEWPDIALTRRDGRAIRGALKATWSTDANGAPLITGHVAEVIAAVEPTPSLPNERSLILAHQALGATHDLKEPLRTLVHSSEQLRSRYRGQLDTDAEEHLRFLHEAAIRMQSQVARLFDEPVERAESKPTTPANAGTVLDRALENLRAAMVTTQAKVTRDTLPTLPFSEDELLQLFQNLVGNALKFRGDEPPRVHVSAFQRAGEWLLSVEDNGVGVATEDLPRLFTLFERGSRPTRAPGSGIGLALCKNIVERYGGRIWASSNPGRGTTFFFTVPEAAHSAGPPSSPPRRSIAN